MSKGLITYVTAGDPSLAVTKEFIETLAEYSDFVEVGIPFSDPVAESPPVEAAHMRALAAGAATGKIFDMLQSVKLPKGENCKLIIYTYANPVFVYGYDKFAKRCRECGVYGLVIPDVPHEELGEFKAHTDKHGVRLVPIVTPTSKQRTAKLVSGAEGYVYLMSPPNMDTNELKTLVAQIKAANPVPVYTGDVSAPAQANAIKKTADGFITATAIAQIIEQHGKQSAPRLKEFIKSLL